MLNHHCFVLSVFGEERHEELDARALLLQHQDLHRRLLASDRSEREQRRREVSQVLLSSHYFALTTGTLVLLWSRSVYLKLAFKDLI